MESGAMFAVIGFLVFGVLAWGVLHAGSDRKRGRRSTYRGNDGYVTAAIAGDAEWGSGNDGARNGSSSGDGVGNGSSGGFDGGGGGGGGD